MKIQHHHLMRQAERGSITLIFIALLGIMMILVAVNGQSLFRLKREIKLLEQKQVKRLNTSSTNITGTVQPPAQHGTK